MPFVLPKSTLFPTGSNSLRNEGCFHITGENHKSRGSKCPGNSLQCRCEQGEFRTRPLALEPLCHTALKRCARQCPGRVGHESCPFTRLSLRLRTVRFLLWAFASFEILCPSSRRSHTLEKNLEPCKGVLVFLWSNTEKVCELYFQRPYRKRK